MIRLWRLTIPSLLIVFSACAGAPPQAKYSGQIITISDTTLHIGGTDTVRFGIMRSGETAVKELLLRNEATTTTAIIDYQRTCGCTILEFDSKPLASGTENLVTLKFDSRGLYGWQFKLVDLKLAGANAPLKIYVEAEVE